MDKVQVLNVEKEAIGSMDIRHMLEALGYGVPAEMRITAEFGPSAQKGKVPRSTLPFLCQRHNRALSRINLTD